jgi:hypothetical protein
MAPNSQTGPEDAAKVRAGRRECHSVSAQCPNPWLLLPCLQLLDLLDGFRKSRVLMELVHRCALPLDHP